jgi:hypothetical protein
LAFITIPRMPRAIGQVKAQRYTEFRRREVGEAPTHRAVLSLPEEHRKLADEFGGRGYQNARGYLQKAMDQVFTQVETWLNTGLVMPGTICTLERIVRELGRRLKKLGYGWTDEGITRAAKILLKKVYGPEDWERHREERADLGGRCRVVLQELKVTKLSITGWYQLSAPYPIRATFPGSILTEGTIA